MATPEKRYYLGVDIGGTKTLACLSDQTGEEFVCRKWPTPKGASPKDFVQQLSAKLREFLEVEGVPNNRLQGAGLGVAGVVEARSGKVLASVSLHLEDYPLAEELSEALGTTVVVGNDVNYGTLAEAWLGAGRGHQVVLGLFVGTGIGGGLVIKGDVVTGANSLAGEFGHLQVDFPGEKCVCGNYGCVEAYAGKWALERDLKARFEATGDERLAVLEQGEGRAFGEMLAKGLAEAEPVVTEVMTSATEKLGRALVGLRHCLDPDVFVLGGGIIEAAGDFILPRLEAQLKADPIAAAAPKLNLAKAQLGDNAVVLGALTQLRLTLGEPVPGANPSFGEVDSFYPSVEAAGFGRVEVNGQLVEQDLYILADGRMVLRDKELARQQFGTSHMLGPDEIKRVLDPKPQRLFVGLGYSAGVSISAEAEQLLAEQSVQLTALPTPAALHAYNAARVKKALILHVTC